MAVAVALTILATTTSARAQAAITDPTPIADPAPSPFIVDFTGEEANVAGQGAVRPDPATFAAEGRACDGCPRRSVGRAFFDTTIINVFYGVANLARGQVTARVTPKSWWVNMEQGWVWDLDNFVVNQVGHPYQGNNYFNAGRANGLSFWESAGITAFGSGTWEYFGETNHASLNDLVNTTLGGIALGEMFHRAAWLVRDTRATGRGRMWKEIAATAIDPVTGAKRFLTGDSSRVSEKPAEMVPSALAAEVSAGVLWRGSNTSAFASAGKPFFEVDAVYGDPTTGRSRTAYDAFGVRLRFGGGGTFSEAKVRGRLLGQPLENDRFQLSVVQAYDYNNNSAYQFGAQSFNVNVAYAIKPSSGLSLYVSGWGGLMALGAVDSIPLTGIAPEEETPEDGGRGRASLKAHAITTTDRASISARAVFSLAAAGRSRRSSGKGTISAASMAPEPITFSINCGWTSWLRCVGRWASASRASISIAAHISRTNRARRESTISRSSARS